MATCECRLWNKLLPTSDLPASKSIMIILSQILISFRGIWYGNLNNIFQFLNNITHIFTHFFIHTYFQKIQTTLLEHCYQSGASFFNSNQGFHIYQTHNYVFLHIEICYLIHSTKHIFCFMNNINTCFHNTF